MFNEEQIILLNQPKNYVFFINPQKLIPMTKKNELAVDHIYQFEVKSKNSYIIK